LNEKVESTLTYPLQTESKSFQKNNVAEKKYLQTWCYI